MNAIDEHTSYSILALYGPSGVGKSTVMKRIAERCRQEEPDPGVMPVVVVQASPEDVGSAARLDFYRQVLHQLRGHVAVRDRILNLPLASVRAKKSTDPAEWLEMRDAVSYALDLLLEMVWRMEYRLYWHSQRLGGRNGCDALPCGRNRAHS